MNVFYAIFNLLRDFWNLLEEFFQYMHPELIQDYNTNDDTVKTE
jgi:hypothetical protein